MGNSTNLIGLMMIRDEEDMLDEALTNHTRFTDAIFVLDGSLGSQQTRSEEICRSYAQMVGYWKDGDTGYRLPLRDGGRQFLLDRARERFGSDNWHIVLHGDEIWGQDPRPATVRDTSGRKGIAVRLYHFFPHVSEAQNWDFEGGKSSIEATSRWYMKPPIAEHRLFWDDGRRDYEVGRHSRVIPSGIQSWQSDLVVKQYNYRLPRQAHARAVQRRDANWQENHYQHLIADSDNFFVSTLASTDHRWAASVPTGDGEATNLTADPLPSLTGSLP